MISSSLKRLQKTRTYSYHSLEIYLVSSENLVLLIQFLFQGRTEHHFFTLISKPKVFFFLQRKNNYTKLITVFLLSLLYLSFKTFFQNVPERFWTFLNIELQNVQHRSRTFIPESSVRPELYLSWCSTEVLKKSFQSNFQ